VIRRSAALLLLAALCAAAPPAPAQEAPSPAPPPAGADQRLVSLDVRGAQITDVLAALARLAGVNIVAAPDVKGAITVRLVRVPFDEALRLVLEPSGLGFARMGSTIVVEKADALRRPILQRYRLANIAASDVASRYLAVVGLTPQQVAVDDTTNSLFVSADPETQERLRSLLAQLDVPDARRATRALRLSYISAADFLQLLGSVLPPPALQSAKVDPASNTLVLTATEAQLREAAALQERVDVPLPQVMIDAMVVEVPTDEIKNLGIAWPSATTFTVTSGGTALAATAPPLTPILTTLIQEDKARLLANPRLAVRDGETARMTIGDKIPFQVINAQGVPSVVILEAGVRLEITPRVNADGYLTVRMHPEVSTLRTPPGPNVPPTISTREADTSLTVRDGSSIVLAGLIQKNETQTTVKVPILGDIPVLGWLFRSTSTTKTDTEVIFVITPHILQKAGS
jgi:type II secretory pathway component GspD/PulD (secretin)